MSDNATTTQGQDVFDDTGTSEGENPDAGSKATDAGAGEVTAKRGNVANDSAEGGEGDQAGDDKTSGTPPENQDDPETVVDAKGQKLIPEHRFKAALKEVTEKLEAATGELQKYTATPIPDKETDPEGHNLHIRMTASSEVMREMRTDYQEVINHYAKLAESNPLLNQAVADHPLPAKLAYDIAKRDLEIKEVDEARKSGEWDKFQAWKKTQTNDTPPEKQTTLNDTITRGLKAVPNLNRSTNASPNRNVRRNSNGDSDDELFAGAL